MQYSGGVLGDGETMQCQGGGSQFSELRRVILNRIVEDVTHQSCVTEVVLWRSCACQCHVTCLGSLPITDLCLLYCLANSVIFDPA